MPLQFRQATTADYEQLETIVVANFEKVTWQKTVDECYGPRNRATLAVARKLVAYLLAVDRRERDFEALPPPAA